MAKKQVEFTLTFFDIAYSLGGRSNVDKLFKILQDIYFEDEGGGIVPKKDLLSEEEYKVLECMVLTYKKDKMFPTWTYLQDAFKIISNAPIRNLGDFNSAMNELFGKRAKEYMAMELNDSLVKAKNVDDLKSLVEQVSGKFKGQEIVNPIKAYTSVETAYDFASKAPQGVTSGIISVDKLTAGFQHGTVASVAGFTSHGKSTLTNNIAYLNALEGKKVGVVSLEITALLCKYIYLSRHSYTMQKPIAYQDVIRAHLTEDERRGMFELIEPDFIERVGKNLAIVETDDVPEYSYAGFELLYSQIEEALGGLDLIIWDHVNQFKYVNPGSNYTGDHYIKFLTDLTKTYVNKQGNHPVTLFVVQTNREGYKRAARNDGRYELTALSDFNELEKSSTYVLFTFADEANRASSESKVQLLKHRLGMTMLDPEMIEVQFPYSMVGDSFINTIGSIKSERESNINTLFFQGVEDSGLGGGFGGSDFNPDDVDGLSSIKKVDSGISLGEKHEGNGSEIVQSGGFKRNIVTNMDEGDFEV